MLLIDSKGLGIFGMSVRDLVRVDVAAEMALVANGGHCDLFFACAHLFGAAGSRNDAHASFCEQDYFPGLAKHFDYVSNDHLHYDGASGLYLNSCQVPALDVALCGSFCYPIRQHFPNDEAEAEAQPNT